MDNKSSKTLDGIIARFIKDLPSRFERFEDYTDKSDWQHLQEEAHKLKGLGTTMGFPQISEICEKISDNCLKQCYEPAVTQVAELKKIILNITKL